MQQNEKMLTLAEAVERKFNRTAHTIENGKKRYTGVAQSVATKPWLQPWLGFSYSNTPRGNKYWPESVVDEWVHVHSHNLVEYVRRCMTHEKAEVKEGARQYMEAYKQYAPRVVREAIESALVTQ